MEFIFVQTVARMISYVWVNPPKTVSIELQKKSTTPPPPHPKKSVNSTKYARTKQGKYNDNSSSKDKIYLYLSIYLTISLYLYLSIDII